MPSSKEGVYITKSLISNATSTVTGGWKNINGLPFTITVRGTFVATVQVYVDNGVNAPGGTTGFAPFGDAITAPSFVSFQLPVNWVKADVTAFTSGTVNVDMAAG